MTQNVDRETVVSRLLAADDILILCHKNPDGDTIGSGTALCLALQQLGKNAAVLCSDPIPAMYDYMPITVFDGSFRPAFVVAVDVAGIQLFGERNNIQEYAEHVNLCIDHHGSNSGYAYETLVDAGAAASAELLTTLIPEMGAKITPEIASCLYTGVATDTGCFRFSNTTAETHKAAAALIEAGADVERLNERLFESRSHARVIAERMALESLEFYYDDRCALICLTWDQIQAAGVAGAELEDLTSLPRSIEGVEVGLTLRQQKDGSFKISVRTGHDTNACNIARRLGGGDARKTLTILEAAAGALTGDKERKKGAKRPIITPDVVSKVMDVATVRYDKDGDDHYDVISAFIKSMRGSDPDATMHYLARMLRAGEDPRFIARRIMIAASEEVGMAAPQVLQVTVAAAQAVAMIGMPEARIILAEAALAVATAPKSNASYNAINAALADVDAGLIGQVPLHLRNAPTALMKSWGNHEGYRYAHDWPGAVAPQQYMPDELQGREYYHPNDRGYEHEVKPRLERIRKILHEEDDNGDGRSGQRNA